MAACNPLILHHPAGGYMVWCRWCRTEEVTSRWSIAVDLVDTHEPRRR